MRKMLTLGATVGLVVVTSVAGGGVFAQDAKPRSVISQSLAPPPFPLSRVEEALIPYPLPKGEEVYASIDGRKMHKYVVEQADISRRFRDNGHPKFWGRITGFQGDTDSAQWLSAKFKQFGLADVHFQSFDLPPQWMPTAWDVKITSGGKSITLDSAQPAYRANGLPAGGIEVDALYAGLGTEADFAGKDAKGKAVFVYSMLGMQNLGAVKRAADKGAAVVLEVSMLPGNMRYQAYPSGAKQPAFTVGNDDGTAARAMIESGTSANPAKVRVSLTVQDVPNLKTALVFGTLPGASDETIYIVAHRDGWFDGSGDNASGVAGMLGLAEFYSKVPKEKRPRTIVFVGLDGHHNNPNGGLGRAWMAANKDKLFSKTALFINIEHPATIMTQSRPRYYPGDELAWANTHMPIAWYAGGKSRPELEKLVWNTLRKFGVPSEFDASPTPPAGDAGAFFRFVPALSAGEYHSFFHTDWETPETVPWTGLEATMRAYAKIIDEVNKMPLSALQRPEEPAPAPGRPAE